MKLGAIVGIRKNAELALATGAESQGLFTEPLGCVEVAGRSMAERMIERFLSAGVEVVSVLTETEEVFRMPWASGRLRVEAVSDLGSAIQKRLHEYAGDGIEHAFVNFGETYTETDLLDFFYFHRESRQAVTNAFDSQGAIALSVVDCAKGQAFGVESEQGTRETGSASYFIREYVNRFSHPRDLRGIAADILLGRCEMRPVGREIRPGVWVGDGAEIHRAARIVAPAYIGSGSKVSDDTLITRLSSIERDCYIDCGTVIEDSSILPNTRIGIWLDVRHAVVSGNKMLSLGRHVTVEISDPALVRSTLPARSGSSAAAGWNGDGVVPDFEKPHPMLNPWPFGVDLIQE